MNEILKLHARDIMQRQVVRLSATTPIRDAIQTLSEERIGAAPVVDASGRVVAMLSVRDIARPERVQAGQSEASRSDYTMADSDSDESDGFGEGEYAFLVKEDYSPGLLGGDTVGDWMSPEVISVEPNWTLQRVCAVMVQNRIHHVPVVEAGKLEGIISTFDIVRCLAK